MVEGRYCSSSTPVVHTSGMHRLSILAGHVLSNQVVVVVGAVLATLTVLGTTLVALDTDMVGSVTALVDTGLVALGPEMIAQTGIGDSSLLSPSAELRFVLCR